MIVRTDLFSFPRLSPFVGHDYNPLAFQAEIDLKIQPTVKYIDECSLDCVPDWKPKFPSCSSWFNSELSSVQSSNLKF
jgi:hypothetical protein